MSQQREVNKDRGHVDIALISENRNNPIRSQQVGGGDLSITIGQHLANEIFFQCDGGKRTSPAAEPEQHLQQKGEGRSTWKPGGKSQWKGGDNNDLGPSPASKTKNLEKVIPRNL